MYTVVPRVTNCSIYEQFELRIDNSQEICLDLRIFSTYEYQNIFRKDNSQEICLILRNFSTYVHPKTPKYRKHPRDEFSYIN